MAALNDVADAWGQVAKGASSGNPRAYLAGGRAVKKADKELQTALQQLGSAA